MRADRTPARARVVLIALAAIASLGAANVRSETWRPSAGHTQVPLWPGAVPDAQPTAGPETLVVAENLVAGKRWLAVERVSRPTLTVYPPTGRNTGVAVVVCPGGG